MQNQITKQAEAYVVALLKEGLTGDHQYHDLHHTMTVRDASLVIGRRYRLNDDELELLELAALFHDTGFVKQYDGHEDASKEIMAGFLNEKNYGAGKIAELKGLVEATRLGTEPETLAQKILKDADFNTFGTTYLEKSKQLRHEWEVFKGIKMKEKEWLENNLEFWGSHQFYTGEGKAMFGDQKRKVLKKFKKQMGKIEKKKGLPRHFGDKPKPSKGDNFSLNSSKSAQMMFKTTLRNQIDLTNIADNKANIMLTINSALITLGIPLIAGELEASPHLVYPAITLLLTCILAIVFATLATRPVKMAGKTDLQKLDKGNTNLFFFGNYYKMPQSEYREGLKRIVENEELLDKTIVNDLYFLGLSLGRKYSRLHTTYSVFMVGMVVTAIVYVLSFLFAQ